MNPRLDTISGILHHKKVPDIVIQYTRKPQRDSTSNVYNKQWDAFTTFCTSKGIHPLECTEVTVAEYLISMFERGALPATIKVHRAAILSVLIHTKPDISDSVIIKNCLRTFEIEKPRKTRVLPKFDINLVLWQLLKPPFTSEDGRSDRDIPLDIFVCKLSFILALACGSRSSEIHAFSRAPGSISRISEREGTTLHISTFPGFLAKNDRPDKVPVPVRIPSMFQLIGRTDAERFWCPVRAIDIYLNRTQGPEYSEEDVRLLRHPNPKVSTTKGHVALWIRRAVSLAYDSAGRGGDDPHVNAHEVRAIAHSLSAYNGASLQEVLDGGRWTGEQSFFKHYLRDMSSALSGPAGKAPIVIAGRVKKV